MRNTGYISPDEFDALLQIITDKQSQYDAALTEFEFATRRDKGKYRDNQLRYWNNCISTCKDIIAYARLMIRNNPNVTGPDSHRIGHNTGGRISTARNKSFGWDEPE